VIQPGFEPHESEGLLRTYRGAGNIGHQSDILPGRQTGDEIIELKHKSHILAPKAGQGRVISRGQIPVAKQYLAARRHIQPPQEY
jgi:hypothetical protein